MPIEMPPTDRYDFPRTVAAARPLRTNARIFSRTSIGMAVSPLSWTSRP